MVIWLLPAISGLLEIPPFYEDESWVYLPAFELLRGNGLSTAALDEHVALLGAFQYLTAALFYLVPFSAEKSIRLIALVFCFGTVIAAYMAANRLAPRRGACAVALLTIVPLSFAAMRYGRPDTAAVFFAAASLAFATYGRFFSSGVAAGLAASIHPVAASGAAVAAVINLPDRKSVLPLVVGGALGALPQALWMFIYWDDLARLIKRFAVSTSLTGGGGLLSSIAEEPSRYAQLFSNYSIWDAAAATLVLFVLPMLTVVRESGRRRVLVVALWAVPMLLLAALVKFKNFYYALLVLPACAVIGAMACEGIPPAIASGIAAVAIAVTGFRYIGVSADGPPIDRVTDLVADSLTTDAVVVSPLIFAGAIQRRPDLRFFAYHALSEREGWWQFPSCVRIDARLREMIAADTRRTSAGAPAVDEVNFVVWRGSELAYLRQIYPAFTEARADCLLRDQVTRETTLRVCRDHDQRCGHVRLITRRLATSPDNSPH